MQNLSPVSDEKDIVTKGYVDAVKSAAAINKSTLGYSGKNLIPNPSTSVTVGNVTISYDNEGYMTSKSQNDSRYWSYVNANNSVHLKAGTYIYSVHIKTAPTSNGHHFAQAYDENDNHIFACSLAGNNVSKFTLTEDKTIYLVEKVNNGCIATMIRLADITDSTYEPYVPDVNTRLLALEDKQAQSGTLLASASIGSSGGDITIENLSAYSSAWAYIDGNSGVNFATNVIIPIAYLAKSTSNSVKLAGGIPSAAYITSSGPQAPKDTSAYITAKVSGNVLSLSLSSGGTIGNVTIVAM